MPKELLPIVDKPLIQYTAEETIAAEGNTRIFVTGRNKRAIEDHFDSNQEQDAALRAKGKNERAQMIRSILPDRVELIFIRQPEQLGFGNADLCADQAVGDDPFAVLLADDILTQEGAGVTAALVKGYEASGCTQPSVKEVDGPGISKYGVVQPDAARCSVVGFVYKLAFEQASSNLASIGCYVLTPDIFEILRGQAAPGTGGEIRLADAINSLKRLFDQLACARSDQISQRISR